MKKFTLLFLMTIFSTASFATTTVYLVSEDSKTSHSIVSTSLTWSGVNLHLDNDKNCIVVEEFLKRNNTSGLELIKLISKSSLVIECDENRKVYEDKNTALILSIFN